MLLKELLSLKLDNFLGLAASTTPFYFVMFSG